MLIFVALWCESQQANIESIYRDLTQAITIENRPMLDLQMEMLADPQAAGSGTETEIDCGTEELTRGPATERNSRSRFLYPLWADVLLLLLLHHDYRLQ